MKTLFIAIFTTAVFIGCGDADTDTPQPQPANPTSTETDASESAAASPVVDPSDIHAAGQTDSGNDSAAVQKPDIDVMTAAVTGNADAIRQHAAAGSDLNQKDASGSTPLIAAATFGQAASITALLKGGADVNLQDNNGSTPLHAAAFMCHKQAVTILLDSKADKSIQNNQGNTALDTVSGPFEEVRGIYDFLKQLLGPAGLEVDYDSLAATRPEIAKMLR